MARPEKVAVVDEIRTKLGGSRRRGPHRVPRARRSTSWPSCARRCAPAGTEYKVFKNTLARRAVEDAGLDEHRRPASRARWRSRSCTATPRRRGQGAARLRPQQPGAGPEGRPARQRGHHARRDRGAGRAAVPRGAARPGGRRVPGAADQGRRPVPGLHPQLRLRREGADRPARRRAREPRPRRPPRPDAEAPAERRAGGGRSAADRGRRRRPKPTRPRPKRAGAEAPQTPRRPARDRPNPNRRVRVTGETATWQP